MTTQMVGHQGVVIGRVAGVQNLGGPAVEQLDLAGDHDDELLALIGGQLRLLPRLRQHLDEKGLHVAVALAAPQGVEAQFLGLALALVGDQLLLALTGAPTTGSVLMLSSKKAPRR